MQEKQDSNANSDAMNVANDTNATKRNGNRSRENKDNKPSEAVAAKVGMQTKAKTAFMYLGPNIPGGRLFNGALFRNEIPEYLNELFEKMGEIKELFVEVKEVPQAKRDVVTAGTEFYRLFQAVQSEIRAGGLNNGI